MSVLDDFESWKQFLAKRLDQAEEKGMSKQSIQQYAHEIGDYLAQNVQAPTKELQTIQELWNVANQSEQEAITNLMIKLVQEKGN